MDYHQLNDSQKSMSLQNLPHTIPLVAQFMLGETMLRSGTNALNLESILDHHLDILVQLLWSLTFRPEMFPHNFMSNMMTFLKQCTLLQAIQ